MQVFMKRRWDKKTYILERIWPAFQKQLSVFYALIMCMFLSANGQDIATALFYFIYLFDKQNEISINHKYHEIYSDHTITMLTKW